MKIHITLSTDDGDTISGVLAQSGIVDLSGCSYSEEAIRSMFEQISTGKVPIVIDVDAGVVDVVSAPDLETDTNKGR